MKTYKLTASQLRYIIKSAKGWNDITKQDLRNYKKQVINFSKKLEEFSKLYDSMLNKHDGPGVLFPMDINLKDMQYSRDQIRRMLKALDEAIKFKEK